MKVSDPKEQCILTRKYLGPHAKDGRVIEVREGKKGIVLIVDNGKSISPRYIAFKTIKIEDNIIDNKKISIFIEEAKKWHKVSGYQYILPVLYIVQYQGRPLICTPFCEIDLRTFIDKKKKLDIIESLIFSAQILKALIFAKKQGINTHQDLKPANILIKDISTKYKDFPPNGIHESIKYLIRVGDFGMADAYKEIDMPQGPYPYMAPEQYVPEEYDSFYPDIFSLGVIIFEMLTGLHPCGKKTEEIWRIWGRKEWRAWATKDKSLAILKNKYLPICIKNLILKMLSIKPEERPTEQDVLNQIIELLRKNDENTCSQLEMMFEYYDKMAEYDQFQNRIRLIQQVSQFSNEINNLIQEVKNEILKLIKKDKTQKECYYFCSLCREIAHLLLKRNKGSDKDRAKYYTELLLNEIIKLNGKLSTLDIFPNLTFKEFRIIKEPYYERDFELYSTIIGWGIDLLEIIIGVEKTKNYFLKKDNYTISAYYKHLVNRSRIFLKDDLKAANMLDQCIKYNPDEPLFYFLKGLWLFFYYQMDAKENERKKLRQDIIKNLDKAIRLDPKWSLPKTEKEQIKKAWIKDINKI